MNTLTDQFKKGYRTTEWWAAAIAGLIPMGAMIAKAFGWDVDAAALGAAMTGLLPGVAYILSRGWLKAARAKAIADYVYAQNLSTLNSCGDVAPADPPTA